MELKPLTCPNCGGAVNRERMICEYCGTKFDNGNADVSVLRVEHFTSPTRVLAAEAIIPNELHALAPEEVIPYAKREIAEKLVDRLLQGDMIEFRSEMDLRACQQIISARLRVLDPHYRFK